MKLPPKIYLDTFYQVIQEFQNAHNTPFPLPSSKDRNEYFQNLAKAIITDNEKSNNKFDKSINITGFSEYLRKYMNTFLVQLNLETKEGVPKGLNKNYFDALYFYAFKSSYEGINKHLTFLSEFTFNADSSLLNKEKKGTSLKEMFFNDLITALNRKSSFIKDERVIPLKEFFHNSLNLSEATIPRFVASHPATLYHYIFNERNQFKENKLAKSDIFSSSENYLICHSLSAHSDSVFLLADLGRFLRFKKNFCKVGKVLLTSTDFAKLNWTIQNLVLDNPKQNSELTEKNLKECLTFRKKLYSRLGFKSEDVQICGFENAHTTIFEKLPVGKGFSTLNTETIIEKGEEYHDFVKSIAKDKANIENRKLTESEELELLKEIRKFESTGTSDKDSLLSFKFIKRDIARHTQIIRTVIDNYKSFTTQTFQYFLLQYFHQYKFNTHLKIAVQREKDFDEVFRELQKQDGIPEKEYFLNGAYFDDYVAILDGQKKSVIPYYFPSGNLAAETKTLQQAEDVVILIKDTHDSKKIKRILENYTDDYQLAILISDLLSFLQFFLYDTPEKVNDSFKDKMRKITREMGDEFATSWSTYCSQDNTQFLKELEKFESHIFTHWGKNTIVPYWFYPFIFQVKYKNDKPKLIAWYVKLISFLLESIEETLGFANGELQHWQMTL